MSVDGKFAYEGGNTLGRRNIVIYFTIYSEYIWIFLDAGRGGGGERDRDISGKKIRAYKAGALADMKFSHLHHVLCWTTKQYHRRK